MLGLHQLRLPCASSPLFFDAALTFRSYHECAHRTSVYGCAREEKAKCKMWWVKTRGKTAYTARRSCFYSAVGHARLYDLYALWGSVRMKSYECVETILGYPEDGREQWNGRGINRLLYRERDSRKCTHIAHVCIFILLHVWKLALWSNKRRCIFKCLKTNLSNIIRMNGESQQH